MTSLANTSKCQPRSRLQCEPNLARKTVKTFMLKPHTPVCPVTFAEFTLRGHVSHFAFGPQDFSMTGRTKHSKKKKGKPESPNGCHKQSSHCQDITTPMYNMYRTVWYIVKRLRKKKKKGNKYLQFKKHWAERVVRDEAISLQWLLGTTSAIPVSAAQAAAKERDGIVANLAAYLRAATAIKLARAV